MRLKIFSLNLLAALLLASNTFSADTFEIDPAHSSATFRLRHLMSSIPGRFRDFSGTVIYDASDITRSSVSAKIVTSSIDTGVEKRDDHLRGADFFDAQKYPEITFKSKSVKKDSTDKNGNRLLVTGIFTMHGVAKEITLPVDLLGIGPDPWGVTRAGFETALTLNRKDFRVNWNKALDQGGFLLDDEVKVNLSIEAAKKKEEGN